MKRCVILDVLLRVLQNFGISDRIVSSIESNNLGFWDLMIDSKREAALRKMNNKSAITKSITALKQMDGVIDSDFFRNPMILLTFNVSKKSLLDLASIWKFSNIKELEILISEELSKKNDGKFPSIILKIKSAIKEYNGWMNLEETKLYLQKSAILITLFEMRKANFEELSKVLVISDLYLVLKHLSSDGFLINEKEVFYFPNNLFYHQKEVDKIIEESKVTSLNEFLSYDIKNIELLKEKLTGKTLQEIANNYGITRERIRQKIKSILENVGEISEVKKYSLIFEKYKLSERDFKLLFNEETKVYYFLKLACKQGVEEPKQYVLELDIPIAIKIQYFEQNQYMLTRNGEVKRVDKIEFFDEILYKHRESLFTPEEFHSIYQEEAKKYASLNLFQDSPRAIEGSANRSLNVINSNHIRFRYFETDLTIAEIDFMNEMMDLPAGLYSMRKLLIDHSEYVEELGIYDEYELHNLYKKIRKKLNIESMTLTRNPEFIIGNIEKKEFIYNILKDFSGESLQDTVEYLYQEYGLRKNSITSYIQNNFKHLISNQTISAEYVKPMGEELEILRSKLGRAFYLRKEVEYIIMGFSGLNYYFSRQLMHDVGYNVVGEGVFIQHYGNLKEAISAVILKNTRFIRGNSLLDSSSLMGSHLVQLEREHKIMCVSDNVYMQTAYLETKGVTKNIITSFVNSIINSYQEKEYFSFPQIVKDGFRHPLMEFGFEDIFYERLLLTRSNVKTVTRITPVILTFSDNSKTTLEKFLSDILIEYPSGIYLDDLVDDINKRYSQILSREKIKEQLKKYGAFYSEVLDKFYFYKEQYLDEVYGK